MKDKQQSYFGNIGTSSLLVIFLVLCLATFAILTLSSARSDYTFSERLAVHRQVYYEASARAEIVVDGIDEILSGIAEELDLNGQDGSGEGGKDPNVFSTYLTRVSEALEGQQIEGISVRTEDTEEGVALSFRIPAGEEQELMVRLQVTDYREHANYYEIRTWEIVNVGEREQEQPLQLLPVIE